MHLHGSRLQRIFVSHLKTLHTHRAMSYTLQNLTPRTSTPSSPFPEPVFQHSEQPCEDPRPDGTHRSLIFLQGTVKRGRARSDVQAGSSHLSCRVAGTGDW